MKRIILLCAFSCLSLHGTPAGTIYQFRLHDDSIPSSTESDQKPMKIMPIHGESISGPLVPPFQIGLMTNVIALTEDQIFQLVAVSEERIAVYDFEPDSMDKLHSALTDLFASSP